MLEVSTSGYYAWQQRSPSARATSDSALLERIRGIHEKSRETYGVPRVHAELQAEGTHVGRKRVARLMRQAELAGASRRKGCWTTIRDRDARPAPDLVQRTFAAQGPDRLWVADIERHEALSNRAVMKGHRRRLVAASRPKLGAA
jgi:putative transposase